MTEGIVAGHKSTCSCINNCFEDVNNKNRLVNLKEKMGLWDFLHILSIYCVDPIRGYVSAES